MTRLLIVQPYVPTYRMPLFRELRPLLAQSGIELFLATGRPDGPTALRRDDCSDTESDLILEQRAVKIIGRQLLIRPLGQVLEHYPPDYVIVEQAIKNLEVYPLLVRRLVRRRPQLAMWGQGRTFSTPQGAASRTTKDWLTRRCDWFFAYTHEGANYVANHGFDPEKITVLLNSTDTVALRSDLEAVTDEQIAHFRSSHGLKSGATALFLGGVDTSKGIDFLVEAARRIAHQITGFRLLVGGEGASSAWVRERQSFGDPVVALGRLEGHQRALAMRAANLMLVPQWVGLVAVDSLAAGLPIVTTQHRSHSPEFNFLVSGRNAVVTEHTIDSYVAEVVSLFGDPVRQTALREKAILDSEPYTIEAMAARFVDGVFRWIKS